MIVMRIEGEKALLDALTRTSDKRRRKALMDRIGSYGVSSTQERFLQERGPDGQGWTPSARAQAKGGKTLRDSARLFQSLTHEADAGSAAWGSNLVYAGIHQFGGTIRPRNAKRLAFRTVNGFVTAARVTMPARPYLGLDAQDRAEIGIIAREWIAQGVGA